VTQAPPLAFLSDNQEDHSGCNSFLIALRDPKGAPVFFDLLQEQYVLHPHSRYKGFVNKCFPKDVKALIKDAENVGYSADLMKSVDKVNDKIRHGRPSRHK